MADSGYDIRQQISRPRPTSTGRQPVPGRPGYYFDLSTPEGYAGWSGNYGPTTGEGQTRQQQLNAAGAFNRYGMVYDPQVAGMMTEAAKPRLQVSGPVQQPVAAAQQAPMAAPALNQAQQGLMARMQQRFQAPGLTLNSIPGK